MLTKASTASPQSGRRNPTSRARAGCRHYRRHCQIIAPCCGGSFWCRHCHNEAKCGNGCGAHEMDRKHICAVVCQSCLTEQPPSRDCSACGQVFGEYFCKDCNFWDDNGNRKKTFHCSKCGICRVGGRENYVHCNVCGSCYPSESEETHRCVENAMRQNCPICLLDLFQSTTRVTILQCGHTIHQDCLYKLQMSRAGLHSLRCPICSASLYMFDKLWAVMDQQIAETPMPPEYQNTWISIMCNDCQKTSSVHLHVLGHKCRHCRSYNTRRA